MRWCLSLACALVAFADDVRVSGTVVDPTGAVIPKASVRVFSSGSTTEIAETVSTELGRFDFAIPASGRIVLKVSMRGFQTRRVKIPASDRPIELGNIKLIVGSCDSPWINCDDFGIGPPPPPTFSHGSLTARANCEMDFSKKIVACGTGRGDVGVVKENGHLHLVASEGVKIAPVNACEASSFTETRVQLDDLGRGDEICLRERKRWTRLIVLDDIDADATEFRLFQVTRKRD